MIRIKIVLRHTPAISRKTTHPEKAGTVRQTSLHSRTPQHLHVSLSCLLLRGRHGHRLEEGALGYSIRKTTRLQMLTLLLRRFLPGATTQEGTSKVRIVTPSPPPVSRSPLQPRSLDLFQPELGLLSGFHLDSGQGGCVSHRPRPPRWRPERNQFIISHQ